MRTLRWAAAPAVSAVTVTAVATWGFTQESASPDSVATTRAQAREKQAAAFVQEREAASGLVWDASLRERLVGQLMALSPEAFAQVQASAGEGGEGVVGQLLGSATSDQVYTPVTPCRFVDG